MYGRLVWRSIWWLLQVLFTFFLLCCIFAVTKIFCNRASDRQCARAKSYSLQTTKRFFLKLLCVCSYVCQGFAEMYIGAMRQPLLKILLVVGWFECRNRTSCGAPATFTCSSASHGKCSFLFMSCCSQYKMTCSMLEDSYPQHTPDHVKFYSKKYYRC